MYPKHAVSLVLGTSWMHHLSRSLMKCVALVLMGPSITSDKVNDRFDGVGTRAEDAAAAHSQGRTSAQAASSVTQHPGINNQLRNKAQELPLRSPLISPGAEQCQSALALLTSCSAPCHSRCQMLLFLLAEPLRTPHGCIFSGAH